MTGPGYGQQPPEYGAPQRQPAYGQPAYGQPGYQPAPGQPGHDPYRQPGQYGPPGYAANPYGRSPVSYEFGVVGTVVAAIGAILVVIAFTALDWTKASPSHFGDISNALGSPSANPGGLAHAYFGWLGWLLLVVTVVLCIAACAPSPAAQALRAIGAIIAAISIAVTFFAIRLQAYGPLTTYLKDARVGWYLTMIGFLLMGAGALNGPRRREG